MEGHIKAMNVVTFQKVVNSFLECKIHAPGMFACFEYLVKGTFAAF